MILCKCSWVTLFNRYKVGRRRIPWQSGSRDELQGSEEHNLAQSRHRGGKRKPRNYNWKKNQNLINQMHAGEVDCSLRKTSRRPKVVGKNNLIWEKQQKTEQSSQHDWMSARCNWMIQHWLCCDQNVTFNWSSAHMVTSSPDTIQRSVSCFFSYFTLLNFWNSELWPEVVTRRAQFREVRMNWGEIDRGDKHCHRCRKDTLTFSHLIHCHKCRYTRTTDNDSKFIQAYQM